MIIAGIDQSFTFTGVCLFDKETQELIRSTGFKSEKKINKEVQLFDKRVTDLSDEIVAYLVKNDVEEVSIESLSLMSHSASSLVLAGLFYVILDKLQKKGIAYMKVPPKTLKAHVRHGNMKKEEMYDLIPEIDKQKLLKLGYKKTSGLYDLSDAYHLGQYLFAHPDKLVG